MSAVFALLCALSYGIADYCGGRATRSATSFAVTLLSQAAGLATILVVVGLFGEAPPSWHDWIWGFVGGGAAAVAVVSFYQAMSKGAMTVVAPLTAVVSAALPVAVGLIQGERPGALTLVGLALAGVAIALVGGLGAPTGAAVRARDLLLVLVAGAGFGMSFIALDEVDSDTLWPLVGFRVASLPLVAVVAVAARQSLHVPRATRRVALLGGVLDMAANVFYALAIRTGLLTVTSVLASLYPVSTVVLALRLDREQVTRLQAIGMAFVVTALALVALGRA